MMAERVAFGHSECDADDCHAVGRYRVPLPGTDMWLCIDHLEAVARGEVVDE